MSLLPTLGLLFALAPVGQREVLKVPVTDAKPLFDRLIAIQLEQKDEFITTAAFEKRRQDRINALFRGNRTFLLAETTARYNADDRKLTLLSGLNLPTEVDSLAYPASIVVDIYSEDKGSYVEQNVFGADAAISQIYFHASKLVCDNSKESLEGLYDAGAGAIKVQFTLSPEEARRRSPNLRILLECVVPKPVKFRIEEPAVSDPEPDRPFETTTFAYKLEANLRKVIVYDVTTREVFFVRRTK